MTHDYKNVMHSRGPSPIMWLWLLAIVAVGSFVSLLFYLDQYDKGKLGSDHSENLRQLFSEAGPFVDDSKANSAKLKPDNQQKQKTQFDFYSLLPLMDVVIPDREVAVSDDEVPRERKPALPRDTQKQQLALKQNHKEVIQYLLQAGSFRDPEQAEKLKAGLALLGIKSAIEKVNIKNSGQWHRVRIGPFTGMREIDKVRSRMRANNIEPILLKDKG